MMSGDQSTESYSYMFGEAIELSTSRDSPVEPDPAPPAPLPQAKVLPAVTTQSVADDGGAPPPNWKKVGSGLYLQLLLQLSRWTDDQLLTAVHAYYPGSKAGLNDLKYNCSMIARRIPVQPITLRIKEERRELLPPPPWDTAFSSYYGQVLPEDEKVALIYHLDQQELAAVAPAQRATTFPPEPAKGAREKALTGDKKVLNQGEGEISKAVPAAERQPSRFRQSVDPNREFDKTSLREKGHLQWCHRDSLAHLTRWAFAGRFINGSTEVLDVGCGPDVQLINILTMPRNQVPKRYVGIDLNNEPHKHPTRQWATLHWQFNFIDRWQELGQFDVVTSFEMIEHMKKVDGIRMLAGLKGCLKPGGKLLLSTPVYGGKAAANHLHEWRVDELKAAIESVGLMVEKRFGTFASAPDLKKVASEEDLRLIERLKEYYGGEYLAIVLAPLYPDASRNNLWVLRDNPVV